MAIFSTDDLRQKFANNRKRDELDRMEALRGVEESKFQAFLDAARKRIDRDEALRGDMVKRAEQAKEAVAKERAKDGEEGAGEAEPLLSPVDVNATAPQVSPTNMNDVVQPGQLPGQAANQMVAQASPVAGGGTQAGPGSGAGIGGAANVMGLPVPPMLQREVREETTQPFALPSGGFIPARSTSTRTETEPNVLTAAQALQGMINSRSAQAKSLQDTVVSEAKAFGGLLFQAAEDPKLADLVASRAQEIDTRYGSELGARIRLLGRNEAEQLVRKREAEEFKSGLIEGRGRRLAGEGESRFRGRPSQQVEDRTAQILLRIGRGEAISKEDRDFLDERQKLSLEDRLLRGITEGMGAPQPAPTPATPGDFDAAKEQFRGEFGRNPRDPAEMRTWMERKGYRFE